MCFKSLSFEGKNWNDCNLLEGKAKFDVIAALTCLEVVVLFRPQLNIFVVIA